MMPEGQLDPLTPQEIRDLFAYLATTNRESDRIKDRVGPTDS